MTRIVIGKDPKGSYSRLICSGHAGFADSGKDIVCAAVSVLVINTINALEELAGEDFQTQYSEEDGVIQCSFPNPLQERSVFLLDVMVYGLQNIQEQYGSKYLQVEFEEV